MGNYTLKDVLGLIKIAERKNHSYYFFPNANYLLLGILLLPTLLFIGFVYYFLKDFEINLGLALYLLGSVILCSVFIYLSFYSVTILNNDTVIKIKMPLRKDRIIPIKNVLYIFRYTKTEYRWGTHTTFYLYMNNDKKLGLCSIKRTHTSASEKLLEQFDTLSRDLSNDLDLEIICKTKKWE